MNRRKFMSFSILTAFQSAFLVSCNILKTNDSVKRLSDIQDGFIESYNNCELEKVFQLYSDDCTYASDSISGGIQTSDRDEKKGKSGIEMARKALGILNRYHLENEMLPIKIESRNTHVGEDTAWIVCILLKSSMVAKRGILTQIFKRRGSEWKIVHHHYSS